MSLPVSVDSLLEGQSVEWERLEFKEGWNPESTLHTICAFANDFHNLGGGYIFIGIGEDSGRPVLPPSGLEPNQLDKIQQKLVELSYRLDPTYTPVISPERIDDEHVIVVWVPGGDQRPYKAPVSLASKNKQYEYYIRKASTTVRAHGQDEQELLTLAANVPFDDRVNHQASLDDLSLALIRGYLQEVGSELFSEAGEMEFGELARRMQIARGADENLRPLNVGLMFFTNSPERFIPVMRIDVAIHPRGLSGDAIREKVFRGPLHQQLQQALQFLRNQVVEEHVRKRPGQAKADRFVNFPYEALEEAVVNAVYHRSYEIREPIEVRVLPEEIRVHSYPGPDRSIDLADLEAGEAVARRYRNRRVGEFLKELGLTEGRGTGIPKMIARMEDNGSPKPQFETDDDRTYFTAILPVHPEALPVYSRQELEKQGLNDRQIEAVRFAERKRAIANRDYRDLNDVARSTAYRELMGLVEAGILTPEGERRGRRYLLNHPST